MRLFLTLITILFSSHLLACDCIMTSIKSQFKETDFIVTGQVIALLDDDKEKAEYLEVNSKQSYKVKLKIKDSFKGGLSKEQIIEIGSNFTNCDIHFIKDKTYLLFLSKDRDKYYLRPCSYSDLVKHSKKYIRKIKKMTKQTAASKSMAAGGADTHSSSNRVVIKLQFQRDVTQVIIVENINNRILV